MKNKLKYFDLRISLVFLAVVFIGTFLHELGHYFVAKQFYNEVILHFDHVEYDGLIEAERPFYKDSLSLLGGPISSNLISLVGLGILLLFRLPKLDQHTLSLRTFVSVILALFCLRSMLIGIFLLSGFNYTNQDEYKVFVEGFSFDQVMVGGSLVTLGVCLAAATMILGVERHYWKVFILNASIGMFFGFLILLIP